MRQRSRRHWGEATSVQQSPKSSPQSLYNKGRRQKTTQNVRSHVATGAKQKLRFFFAKPSCQQGAKLCNNISGRGHDATDARQRCATFLAKPSSQDRAKLCSKIFAAKPSWQDMAKLCNKISRTGHVATGAGQNLDFPSKPSFRRRIQ